MIFKQIYFNSKDGTLTGTTTLSQSGPGSNTKKRILHTSYISRTGTSLSDEVYCHTQDTPFEGGFTPLQMIQSMYSKPL